MTEKTLKAALIGCGDICKAHLPTFAALDVETLALCDTNLDKAKDRQAEYGLDQAQIFDDYKRVLEIPEIDFVTIATPVAFHAPITIAALEAGKHVACEKPSTLDVKENRQIVEAAKKADKKVIFFSSRMRPGYPELALKFVQDGDLGDIYRVSVEYYRRRGRPGLDCVTHARWFLDKDLAGGGVIMDMGQYFIDMVMNLVGWPTITAVSATAYRGHDHNLPADVKFDVEEHCTILARTEGKLSFSFDFAWVAHHSGRRSISLLGAKGGLRMDDNNPLVYYSNKGGPWNWVNTTPEWKPKGKGGEVIYGDFVRAIQGEAIDIGTTPEQALAITELTQMALLSAAEKREVRREELE